MSKHAPRSKTAFIVIHHSATPASKDIGASELDLQHRARGFDEIGYHLVIRRDGKVEYGREISVVGAHVRGFNEVSVGLCLVGGRTEAKEYQASFNFTPEQWRSLAQVLSRLARLYPEALIVGHNDLSTKDCPGFNVRRTLAAMLRDYPDLLQRTKKASRRGDEVAI